MGSKKFNLSKGLSNDASKAYTENKNRSNGLKAALKKHKAMNGMVDGLMVRWMM